MICALVLNYAKVSTGYFTSVLLLQRKHDVIITSVLRQNDVAASFWRNNGVIIASYVRRVSVTSLRDI